MKTSSKELYAYLEKSGVLLGTEEDIAQAKREYRRLYKQHWKQQKKPRKEIRIEFTLKEFAVIKQWAVELQMPHTTYSRSVILQSIKSKFRIQNIQALLEVLQTISMVSIASLRNIPSRELSKQLIQVEEKLLLYIQKIRNQ
jgi:hypothetical protein